MTDDRPVSLAAVLRFIDAEMGALDMRGACIKQALRALPTVAPATHGGREVTGEAMALATSRKAWLDAGSPDDGDERRAFFSALLHFDIANGPVFATPPKPSPAPEMLREWSGPDRWDTVTKEIDNEPKPDEAGWEGYEPIGAW